jgi:hypothetical protein
LIALSRITLSMPVRQRLHNVSGKNFVFVISPETRQSIHGAIHSAGFSQIT